MNFKVITLNTYKLNENNEKEIVETKNIKFRLESNACVTLERDVKKSILEYIGDESVTMVTTMLRYMRMFEDKNITINSAQKLYDELIDDGWTFKRIIQDIIYETLVVSGFLEETEWEEMKQETEALMKKLKEEKKQALANI